MAVAVSDIKIYVANLGKYNEGELMGAWFSLPIDPEELAEKIGLNFEYEEYAIHDYEAPFPIDEYESLDYLNYLYGLLQEIDGTPVYTELGEILGYWFKDIGELLENVDEIICHTDCESMTDVAEKYIQETGILSSLPENMHYYFDYAALGRDMDIEGSFLVTSNGVFEYTE